MTRAISYYPPRHWTIIGKVKQLLVLQSQFDAILPSSNLGDDVTVM